MFVSFTMRLSIDCSSCRMAVPVNGIVPHAHCSHCGSDTKLDARWWASAFEPAWFATAIGYHEGDGRESQMLGHISARLAFGRRTPRCQACKGPDLDLATLAQMVGTGRCFCPKCGHPIQLRAADDLCRRLQAHAQFVVGETAAARGNPAIERKTQPVVFHCMNCSGPLHVDGSSRSVVCEHCNETNYLPEGLWMQLNPVPKEQVFFLVCFLDQAAQRELRWSDDEMRTKDARSAHLAPEDARLLAADRDDDVRRALAENPHAPAEVLVTLAHDAGYEVRRGVAANPAATPAALEVLTADRDSDVMEALLKRDLPPELVDRVAQHSSSDWRKRAIEQAHASVDTLHRLEHDSDEDVRHAAHARLKQLKAQGIDIHSGHGLFGKLFGG